MNIWCIEPLIWHLNGNRHSSNIIASGVSKPKFGKVTIPILPTRNISFNILMALTD